MRRLGVFHVLWCVSFFSTFLFFFPLLSFPFATLCMILIYIYIQKRVPVCKIFLSTTGPNERKKIGIRTEGFLSFLPRRKSEHPYLYHLSLIQNFFPPFSFGRNCCVVLMCGVFRAPRCSRRRKERKRKRERERERERGGGLPFVYKEKNLYMSR